jgi:hypothetical protein
VKFFVGNSTENSINQRVDLEPESDMVHLNDMMESYENLSRKTLALVVWAHDHGFETVLKVDDDTFVRMDLLTKFLATHSSLNTTYAGHFQWCVF